MDPCGVDRIAKLLKSKEEIKAPEPSALLVSRLVNWFQKNESDSQISRDSPNTLDGLQEDDDHDGHQSSSLEIMESCMFPSDLSMEGPLTQEPEINESPPEITPASPSQGGAKTTDAFERQQDDDDDAMVRHVVNGVARFLAVNASNSSSEGKSCENVVDIASRLLGLCNDKFCLQLYDTACKRKGPPNFPTFLRTALEIVRESALAAIESIYDFEFLWGYCVANSTFQQSLGNIKQGDEGRKRGRPDSLVSIPPEDVQKCAWHLSVLHQDVRIYAPRRSIVSKRRQDILASACAIALLCCSFEPVASTSSDQEHPRGDEITKKRKLMSDKDETYSGLDDEEEQQPNNNTGSSSKEKDAIAALSMMMGASSSEDSSDSNKATEQHEDAFSIVVTAASKLMSFLSLSIPHEDNGSAFHRTEIERELFVTLLCLNYLVEKDAGSLFTQFLFPHNSNGNDILISASNFCETLLEKVLEKFDFSGLGSASEINETIQTVIAKNQHGKGQDIRLACVDKIELMVEKDCRFRICRRAENAITTDKDTGIWKIFDPDDLQISSSTEDQVAEVIATLKTTHPNDASNESMADHMELSDWCSSLLSISIAKPSKRLLMYLKASDDEFLSRNNQSKTPVNFAKWEDIILPPLKRAVTMLSDGTTRRPGETATNLPKRVSVSLNPLQVVLTNPSNGNNRMAVALSALYFHALEAILLNEATRLKTNGHPKLVRSSAFHQGLITCCYVSLLKAFGETKHLALGPQHRELDTLGAIATMGNVGSSPFTTFIKVSESFNRSLNVFVATDEKSCKLNQGFPKILQAHVSHCEVLVLDSIFWSSDEFFFSEDCVSGTITDPSSNNASTDVGSTGTASWPPPILLPNLLQEKDGIITADVDIQVPDKVRTLCTPDQRFVGYVFRKLVKIIYYRILVICDALGIPQDCPVSSQTFLAFRYLLRAHVCLLRERHVDQLLLCTLFGVNKIIRDERDLSFRNMVSAYMKVRGKELGEESCYRIVHRIRLKNDGEKNDQTELEKNGFGNVIHFYNQVFVPAMKRYLLCEPLKKSAEDARNISRKYILQYSPGGDAVGDDNLVFATSLESDAKTRESSTPSWSVATSSSKTRMMYTFGDAGRKELDLANEMVTK